MHSVFSVLKSEVQVLAIPFICLLKTLYFFQMSECLLLYKAHFRSTKVLQLFSSQLTRHEIAACIQCSWRILVFQFLVLAIVQRRVLVGFYFTITTFIVSVQVSLFELLLNLQNYTTTLILLITFPCHILRITHVLLNYIIFRLDANPVNGANVVHLKL